MHLFRGHFNILTYFVRVTHFFFGLRSKFSLWFAVVLSSFFLCLTALRWALRLRTVCGNVKTLNKQLADKFKIKKAINTLTNTHTAAPSGAEQRQRRSLLSNMRQRVWNGDSRVCVCVESYTRIEIESEKKQTKQDVASEQRQQLLSLTWQLHVACRLAVAAMTNVKFRAHRASGYEKQEEVKLSYSHLTCCHQFSGLPNVIVVEKKNQQIVQIATGKTSSSRRGSLATQGSQAKAKTTRAQRTSYFEFISQAWKIPCISTFLLASEKLKSHQNE